MKKDSTEADNWHNALRVIMMPRDTNQYGTVFGGVILSYIDQSGFVEARRHASERWVTASMDKVNFQAPVYVGDIVAFRTRTTRKGTTSVIVEVLVEAERYDTGRSLPVTKACLTMVCVDQQGSPMPFDSSRSNSPS